MAVQAPQQGAANRVPTAVWNEIFRFCRVGEFAALAPVSRATSQTGALFLRAQVRYLPGPYRQLNLPAVATFQVFAADSRWLRDEMDQPTPFKFTRCSFETLAGTISIWEVHFAKVESKYWWERKFQMNCGTGVYSTTSCGAGVATGMAGCCLPGGSAYMGISWCFFSCTSGLLGTHLWTLHRSACDAAIADRIGRIRGSQRKASVG
jgi:hypothetical protein